MIKLLVFDLDGTLVDTRHDIVNSVNRALVMQGYAALPFETVLSGIGDGANHLIDRSLLAAQQNQVLKYGHEISAESDFTLESKTVLQNFLIDYETHCMVETKPYPGVESVLEHFKGIQKAVLTNKPETHTHRILKGLNLAQHFSWIVGGDNPHGAKPNPKAFHNILEQAGIKASEAVMIGDGIQDLKVAENLKSRFIGFLSGIGDRKTLLDENPQMTIESMEFLPNAILELNKIENYE